MRRDRPSSQAPVGRQSGGQESVGRQPDAELRGPAADPQAPYVRLAVAGLIARGAGSADSLGRGRPRAASDSIDWLLVRRTEPVDAWDPPGGRVEEGEDLVSAVVREVSEEVGLCVAVAGPCYAYLTFHKGERLLAVSMACRPLEDPDDVHLEAGLAGWRWTSVGEWEELAASGRSTWNDRDVRRAARTAMALWDGEAK